jgi:hypothetical protein
MAIFRVPINITFPGAGSPGANIWHIRTATPALSTELTEANTLIGYIRTFYNYNVAHFPATTVISLGTVTEEETSREITPTMATVTGVGTGSAPQLLAVVVTWRTTVASRRGRGRTFLGPLATADMQNDGTPSSTLMTDVNSSAASLVTSSLAMGSGAIGVYGYRDAKLPGKANLRNPSDPRIFRDVTGKQVRDLFGSLRSRRD